MEGDTLRMTGAMIGGLGAGDKEEGWCFLEVGRL